MIHHSFYTPTQRQQQPERAVVFPTQVHGSRIVTVISWAEDCTATDWLYAYHGSWWVLGVKTADCAAISFVDDVGYGIIHAWWRWLVNGIIPLMMDRFIDPVIQVSPLLQSFEIQRDACYEQLSKVVGDSFVAYRMVDGKEVIIFHFLAAIQSILPPTASYDRRDTAATPTLASRRRDRTSQRNVTCIGEW